MDTCEICGSPLDTYDERSQSRCYVCHECVRRGARRGSDVCQVCGPSRCLHDEPVQMDEYGKGWRPA